MLQGLGPDIFGYSLSRAARREGEPRRFSRLLELHIRRLGEQAS